MHQCALCVCVCVGGLYNMHKLSLQIKTVQSKLANTEMHHSLPELPSGVDESENSIHVKI